MCELQEELERINKLTKQALRGNLKALKEVLSFLWKYRELFVIRYTAYLLVYQYAMNCLLSLSEYCRLCGGKCCREGLPLPLYDFDVDELESRLGGSLKRYARIVEGVMVLPRPCPFLEGWKCSIHEFKPYACLSYPFATEDEQLKDVALLEKEPDPLPYVPSFCIAGIKTKTMVASVMSSLKSRLGRAPTPIELLEELIKEHESKC